MASHTSDELRFHARANAALDSTRHEAERDPRTPSSEGRSRSPGGGAWPGDLERPGGSHSGSRQEATCAHYADRSDRIRDFSQPEWFETHTSTGRRYHLGACWSSAHETLRVRGDMVRLNEATGTLLGPTNLGAW